MGKQSGKQPGVDRRGFIKAGAGAAAGATAIGVPIALSQKEGAVIEPATAAPSEPVMAYLRDAKSSEVSVLAGTTETTYRDPELAKRLISAATRQLEGGSDVIAP